VPRGSGRSGEPRGSRAWPSCCSKALRWPVGMRREPTEGRRKPPPSKQKGAPPGGRPGRCRGRTDDRRSRAGGGAPLPRAPVRAPERLGRAGRGPGGGPQGRARTARSRAPTGPPAAHGRRPRPSSQLDEIEALAYRRRVRIETVAGRVSTTRPAPRRHRACSPMPSDRADTLEDLCRPTRSGRLPFLLVAAASPTAQPRRTVRSAECAGATAWFCEAPRRPPLATVAKVAAGALEHLDFCVVGDPRALDEMTKAGVWTVGLPRGERSSTRPLGEVAVALVMGSEEKGSRPRAPPLRRARGHPQHGNWRRSTSAWPARWRSSRWRTSARWRPPRAEAPTRPRRTRSCTPGTDARHGDLGHALGQGALGSSSGMGPCAS